MKGTGSAAGAFVSDFGALREPVFRALWTANIFSNVGSWMQDVGASWLMTSLSASPLMIALVQAATTLPIFALALPAGALADVIDRRRLLIVTQTWMLLSAGTLGLLTALGLTGPWTLLALTFALGMGTALNAPAWQAIVPELVPRSEIQPALALNGIGINLARTVGPALGGLVIAAAGPGAVFLLNSVSFVGVIFVLRRWRRPSQSSTLPAERIFGAMQAGIRYVRHAPDMRAVLVRAAAFIFFGSALWALLPGVVRFGLKQGPEGYGLVLGCLGAGAVAGAAFLGRARRAFGVNALVAGSILVFAAVLLLMAWVPSFAAICVVMFLAGGAWLTLLTSFNASAQAILPHWVRGRALAVYLLTFFGGMAAGSALWGTVATHAGPRAALTAAGLGLVAGLALTARHRLATGEGLDLAPSRHWPAPFAYDAGEGDRGPVLVTVEYQIDAARSAEFADAMRAVRRIRLRDGAVRWDLFQDASAPGRHVETFLVESWMEHLRQHERLTVSDRDVEQRARSFHTGAQPPVVTHYIARDLPA